MQKNIFNTTDCLVNSAKQVTSKWSLKLYEKLHKQQQFIINQISIYHIYDYTEEPELLFPFKFSHQFIP